MTENEREKKISEGADLVVEWFRSTEVPPCDSEMFWSQVNSGLYGHLPWLFTSEAPKPDEINPTESPWAGIKRSRVESKDPASRADIITDHVKEMACWAQRLLPNREILKAAPQLTERRLLRVGRELR